MRVTMPSPDDIRRRRAIVAEATSWLGTPFVHQGAVKGVGVDCVQFVRAVYIEVGVLPVDLTDGLPYPRGYWRLGVENRYVRELCEPYFDRIALQHVTPGCLVLFHVGEAEAHGAIVSAWPLVIHAKPEVGVVEECADRNYLADFTLTSCWRPKVAA